MDNAQIARLVQSGAPEAFDALLERYGGEIQGVAYLILRDRFDAEDVMSETLITAWQKGRELRDPSTLRSWLLRIATNKALSVRRKQTRSVQITETMEFGGPDTTGPCHPHPGHNRHSTGRVRRHGHQGRGARDLRRGRPLIPSGIRTIGAGS